MARNYEISLKSDVSASSEDVPAGGGPPCDPATPQYPARATRREEKISRIRAALAAGKYRVPNQALADALLIRLGPGLAPTTEIDGWVN